MIANLITMGLGEAQGGGSPTFIGDIKIQLQNENSLSINLGNPDTNLEINSQNLRLEMEDIENINITDPITSITL